MSSSVSLTLAHLLRQARTGLLLLLLATVGLGLVYPLAVFAVGRLVPDRADGQVVTVAGAPVGSALIGQGFPGAQWFHPRPSAAGDGYDPTASGASNLGPESADLLALVRERRAAVAAEDGTAPADLAPRALSASWSGLPTHIPPQHARRPVAPVAAAPGLSEQRVADLVAEHTRARGLAFLGEPTVNVLELNLALRSAAP